jgi:hypothetical protein
MNFPATTPLKSDRQLRRIVPEIAQDATFPSARITGENKKPPFRLVERVCGRRSPEDGAAAQAVPIATGRNACNSCWSSLAPIDSMIANARARLNGRR